MAAIEFGDVRVSYRSGRGVVTALDGPDLAVPKVASSASSAPTVRARRRRSAPRSGYCGERRARIEVLGRPVPRDLGITMRRTRALVEQPSFSPNISPAEVR